MISSRTCVLLVLAAVIGAIALRMPKLAQRPMHTDEAVHAIKFGQLLEHGAYIYDPVEFHGPTLNYFTLVPAYIFGQHTLADVKECTLRIVPAFFGVLLVLLVLPVRKELGHVAACIAALLIAISPAMVFYSRYYIQEMLLVCFLFGMIVFGFKFMQSGSIFFAAITGIFAGLAHATKETFLIAILCVLGTVLFLALLERQRAASSKNKTNATSVLVMVSCGILTSILFYSSFFTNSKGVLDSVRTYTVYFERANQNAFHIHPWYYYFQVLLASKCGALPDLGSLMIILLSIYGGIVAFAGDKTVANKRLWQFIALYTFFTILAYSSMPYKTPWCLINFLPGMLLLCALAISTLITSLRKKSYKMMILIGLCILAAHQIYLSVWLNFKYFAGSCNPYAYSQTTTDIPELSSAVIEAVSKLPDGNSLRLQVICSGSDYWPLPWYLRTVSNAGWYTGIDANTPPGDIIIVSKSLVPALITRLYELAPPGKRSLYVPLVDKPTYLRAGIEIDAYIRQDLLERIKQK